MAKDANSKLKPAKDWIKTGSAVGQYESGFDPQEQRDGNSAGCIRSKSADASGFVTLMKMSDAGDHRGKRVRMSVWTKSAAVDQWAGAWMRVDGDSGNPKKPFLAFDNMQNRPIAGTSDWTKHEVVLDVAEAATKIAYGVLLSGPGCVWMDDFQFEVVDHSVPTTDQLTGQSAKSNLASLDTKRSQHAGGKAEAAVLALPEGWIKAGSHPHHYDMGLDSSEHHSGTKCSVIRSNVDEIEGFGTLMQFFDAGKFRDQRVKLSAWTKSLDVAGWAGVWMRVDGPNSSKSLAFDNMQDRPISGTNDWTVHEIVLDVSAESTNVAFGVLLHGVGTVWMDDFQFKIVDKSTPTTGAQRLSLEAPANLSFED